MEKPSEEFDPSEEVVHPLVDSEPSQTDGQDSSDNSGISQPDNLEKDMRKLTIDPSAKKPPASLAGLKLQRSCRSRILHRAIKMRNVENKSEKILREVQSAFPKRRVRTLLSVQNNPVAKMK
ncbi:developmental pluripotency-associated protein 3-like [Alexandromys fortis]|uniref:developmental pluripotency-associated protein 3-like n=1 Tax=Alexandromys fortis TaxID=100897 RepID=UPI0021521161|nr:developmental pluripotency-associated protein 3-like [Microtus fortis]